MYLVDYAAKPVVDSATDTYTVTNPLMDLKGAKIGSVVSVCKDYQATDGSELTVCDQTYTTIDGSITGRLVEHFDGVLHLGGVESGTRKFAGWKGGEITEVSARGDNNVYTVVING